MLENDFNYFLDDKVLKFYRDENELNDDIAVQDQFYISGKVPQIIPDDELFN